MTSVRDSHTRTPLSIKHLFSTRSIFQRLVNTSRCFFLSSTLSTYIQRQRVQERERKENKNFFFEKNYFTYFGDLPRHIKNDGSITFTSVETEAFINHKIAYKAGKRESTSRNEKTGKQTRLRVRAVMTPEYLMAFVVVDPLERQILNRCQLNSFRVASGCSLAPQ